MNCKRATELASRQKEARLTLGQKVELKIHLLLCRCCRDFKLNVDQLSDSMAFFLTDSNSRGSVSDSKNKKNNSDKK